MEKIAKAAREYVAFLNATGHRHRDRETILFCEAVEAADAPVPVVVVSAPAQAEVPDVIVEVDEP